MRNEELPSFFAAFVGLDEEELETALDNGWLYKDEHGNYRFTPKALELAAWMTK